jgi:hypothetical protein
MTRRISAISVPRPGPISANVKGAGAKRIAFAAFHHFRQVPAPLRLTADHGDGWPPGWPFGLARHAVCARPGEALLADTNGIFDGLAVSENEEELSRLGLDQNGACRHGPVERDNFTLEMGKGW